MQKILKPLVNKKTKYVPKGSGGFQPFPAFSFYEYRIVARKIPVQPGTNLTAEKTLQYI